MELRNKKTGQVGNFIINKDHFECVDLDYVPEYRNLAELNEEWEDYEELKEYFYIYANQVLKGECDGIIEEKFKEIGNYFETREEAEVALRKLKAWKRLKDKGFEFRGWTVDDGLRISICTNTDSEGIYDDKKDLKKDLDLFFEGEE